MDFFRHNNVYNFTKFSTYGLVLSGVIIVLIFIFSLTKGFGVGIDFAGGSIVQVQYSNKDAPISDIRELLNNSTYFRNASITEFGSKNEVIIKFPFVHSDSTVNISDAISDVIKSTGDFEIRRVDMVGPKAGSELTKKGILSLCLALISMMIYVSFRYEWRFALAGIIALIHDVIIAGSSILIFDIDLSLDVIAALLTLIGYSINDTIIIFDRIREQTIANKINDSSMVINEAISSTLSRTVLTSLTVFFVILVLFIFGSDMLKGFTVPMLIGCIVGTYSSMFVAPKLAILFGFDVNKYYKRELDKQKRKQDKERMRKMYENGRV